MNKKTIAIVVLLVVVIVIVGVIGFNHRAKAPEVQSVGVSTSTATQVTSTATTTATASGLTVVISTSTPKNYIGSSFSFVYPGSWFVFSASPLMMTDFNGKYRTGGVIPAGGAQLGVVTTTVGGSVADIMTTELMSATSLTTSTVAVNGVACTKATYQVGYAPGATAQNISLYCLRGTELWKIYFSYPAGDAAEKADLSTLSGMLSSMKFL